MVFCISMSPCCVSGYPIEADNVNKFIESHPKFALTCELGHLLEANQHEARDEVDRLVSRFAHQKSAEALGGDESHVEVGVPQLLEQQLSQSELTLVEVFLGSGLGDRGGLEHVGVHNQAVKDSLEHVDHLCRLLGLGPLLIYALHQHFEVAIEASGVEYHQQTEKFNRAGLELQHALLNGGVLLAFIEVAGLETLLDMALKLLVHLASRVARLVGGCLDARLPQLRHQEKGLQELDPVGQILFQVQLLDHVEQVLLILRVALLQHDHGLLEQLVRTLHEHELIRDSLHLLSVLPHGIYS